MNNQPGHSKEPKDPLLMEHEADGIKELDNLLPRWWVWLFYITIVFSIAYMGYYHVFNVGDLQAAEYAKEAKAGEEIKSAALAKFESSMSSLEPIKDQAQFPWHEARKVDHYYLDVNSMTRPLRLQLLLVTRHYL